MQLVFAQGVQTLVLEALWLTIVHLFCNQKIRFPQVMHKMHALGKWAHYTPRFILICHDQACHVFKDYTSEVHYVAVPRDTWAKESWQPCKMRVIN